MQANQRIKPFLARTVAGVMLALLGACQPAQVSSPAPSLEPAVQATDTSAPANTGTPVPTATTQAVTLTPIPTLPPQDAPPESPAMNEVTIPTPFDTYVENLVTQAKADLAQRLSIDPATIELVDASSVTWPDSSMGCPQPGMAYAQVLVEGTRLRLRAGGHVYSYHSGEGRAPFLCK